MRQNQRLRLNLPAGLQPLASPTNLVWILGRTQTNGPDDYAPVHTVQHGYKLVPLSAFGRAFTPPKGAPDPSFDAKTPPVEKLKAMSAATYFDTLARLNEVESAAGRRRARAGEAGHDRHRSR